VIGLAPHRRRLRPARAPTDQGHVARQRDRLGADTAARNLTSGFAEPEVELREQILMAGPIDEAPRAIGRPHGPKYGENHPPGGAGGQTRSRNMAATRFFRLSDPDILFDPQYIMESILHRYEAVTRRCYHYAIVTADGLGENIPSPKGVFVNFERTLLEFRSSEFRAIFRVVRPPECLSNAVKKSKI